MLHCTFLHWSEQWALHPHFQITCCVQRQQLDHWHCCNQAVEVTDNHGNQCMSFQLVADVMNRLLNDSTIDCVKFCTGHGRVCTGLRCKLRVFNQLLLVKKPEKYSIITCNILCLIKGRSGFVSLAAYPISTVIPLDLSSESSCTCRHCTWVTFPRNSGIQYPATCTFLVETILSLHVEDFQPTFFVKKKYLWIFLLDMHILPLIQGQYGLVSLATYPISPLYVMDLSSEPTCTYLYGMKAPDGVSYFFEKLYHVLLRLSVVSLQTSIPVDQWAAVFPTVVSSLADLRS